MLRKKIKSILKYSSNITPIVFIFVGSVHFYSICVNILGDYYTQIKPFNKKGLFQPAIYTVHLFEDNKMKIKEIVKLHPNITFIIKKKYYTG